MSLTYPRSDMDQPKALLNAAGTMWSEQFKDRDVLLSLFKARLLLYEGAYTEYKETLDTLSQQTVPVYHKEPWVPIVLTESEMEIVPAYPLTYDENQALYGSDAGEPPYNQIFEYGDGLTDKNYYMLPLPSGCLGISLLSDNVVSETFVSIDGCDHYIDKENKKLILSSNPFEQSSITVSDSINSNNELDREALLFGFQCEYDWDYIYTHYGYVINLDFKSSEGYRQLLQAIWQSHSGGPSLGHLLSAYSAVYDVPLAETQETVESILDHKSLQIITDKNVYTYPKGSTTIVSAGDIVKQYDPLVDTLMPLELTGAAPIRGYSVSVDVPTALQDDNYEAFERSQQWYFDHDYLFATEGLDFMLTTMTNRGNSVTTSVFNLLQRLNALYGLGVNSALLGGTGEHGLIFPNTWERIKNPNLDSYGNGVRFTLKGFDSAITNYWNAVEAKGQTGLSLALRLWVAQGGSESALSSSTTKAEVIDLCSRMTLWINPMFFLLWSILGNNITLVKVKHAYTGEDKLPITGMTQMRKALFPITNFITFIEMQAPTEYVTIDNWTESVNGGSAPAIEESYGLVFDENIDIGIIEGTAED